MKVLEYFEDWRFFILLHILCAGIWGVLVKMATSRVGSLTAVFVAVTSAWLLVSCATLGKLTWQSPQGVVLAVAAGVLGGISSIAFYKASSGAPANVVVPLGSLYLLVTVVLS